MQMRAISKLVWRRETAASEGGDGREEGQRGKEEERGERGGKRRR